jgi:malate dehydrogenase (oxaloacetate-decarboxylating)
MLYRRQDSTDGPFIETDLFGYELLNDPLLNKGTAFTEEERDAFELHGLLPPNVATLEEQVTRRMQAFLSLSTDLERYVFLRGLQDSVEILFYALLLHDLARMLPVVYTPTVGLGCQEFSHTFRKPRGLFLSYPHMGRIKHILANPHFDNVEAIVVTDGERILGLGDQGAGGMGIPIGKLSLYTACGGLHPATTLPVMLDVGTNNAQCLCDPVYVGWRHERVRGPVYDQFIEAFVSAVIERWPHVLLQWEDFARDNATRLLERYRNRLCTFNDDIQGTAVVTTGTLLSAINVTGVPLTDQHVAVLGAGSAGVGVSSLLLSAMMADGLSEKEARSHFYLVDRDGLLVEGMSGILDFQRPFTRSRAELADWRLEQPDQIGLWDVARNARLTVLIGVSGQPDAFPERVVRTMAEFTQQPIIFPLSNPTSRSEATPSDLLTWTEGRAVIGTGSPFPPVLKDGLAKRIDQTNNSYVFPGIGLGVISAQARHISDGMLLAAARALAEISPSRRDPSANLLPPVTELREVSYRVALAIALQAQREGLAEQTSREKLEASVRLKMWTPNYRPYRRTFDQGARRRIAS